MKKILIVLIFILLLPLNVQALGETVNYPDQSGNNINSESNSNESQGLQKLYDYISNMDIQDEMLRGVDAKTYVSNFMKSGQGKISLEKIWRSIVSYCFGELQASLKLTGALIIIAIVCALINNLQKAFEGGKAIGNIAYFACYALIITIITKSFYVGAGIAKDTIKSMTDFMAALMPVLMVLLASVGGFTEAAVMDPVIIGAINLSAQLFVTFIIPLIFIGFALNFVSNLSEEYKIDKLVKLINQIALWSQGIVMTIFIGVITIRGITSKTIDQVTVKTAKYAVDNFVPIVGKCLSDAISAVAGYSILLKNALSSLGLFVLLIIVILPVIKILAMAFLYKFSAAVIQPISDSRLVNCISSAGDSLILIMSCLICVSVMFFIMISIVAGAGKMALGG